MKNIWSSLYQVTKEKLENFPKIGGIVSAWNANIDAVVKLSGKRIENLLENHNQIYNSSINMVCTPEDLLRGLIKCFKDGIAEEWIVENEEIFLWMKNNIGYDKLQMGGQGGIIANTAAICGVNPVFVHCASLPKMQADLFLELDNLVSFDTAGKEQYRSIGSNFYKDAFIVCLVYDITNKKSFEDIQNFWYNDLKRYGEKCTITAIVGNKSDLYEEEEVKEEEGRKYAESINCPFFLVSAKKGYNIENLFNKLVGLYLGPEFSQKLEEMKIDKGKTIKIENVKKKKKKKCC